MGGSAGSPNKSKMADGGYIKFLKNAKSSVIDLHTISYKDATRGRLRTTTARFLSAL